MFCNSWCANNSTNFNNNSCGCNRCNSCGCGNNRSGCGCGNGCNSCGCGNNRSNGGCGWYTCPCSGNNFFWLPSTANNQVPPTTQSINLGHFTNLTTGPVASSAAIPLSLTRQVGTLITSSGTGALLPTGLYEVSYSLSGSPTPDTDDDASAQPAPPSQGISTVGLKLNGVIVPNFTQSASTTTTTAPYNISSHGVLDVTAPNSILTLNNLGNKSQNFTSANLLIRKLS